jgi:Concanavalin A-like lectin/glucanases superfamily
MICRGRFSSPGRLIGIVAVLALIAATPTSAASSDPVAAYSFDEGEGGTAHDSVGDHDGTVAGADWVEGGRFGGALRFKAEDEDSVEVPADAGLDLTDALTLEAWVKPQAEGAWLPIIAKESATSHGYAFYGAGQTELVPVGLVEESITESAEVTAEEALENGQWSHLALTSDGVDLRLYIGGQLVGMAAARSAQLTEGALRIGGHDSWSHYFDGLIDEVRIYNRALGDEEIRETMDDAIIVNGTVDPEIWGRAMVGESLMALGGEWSATSTVEREFGWWRCDGNGDECEPIEDEEDSKWYDVTPEDVGHTFRVGVAAKAGGFEDSAFSQPTEPVVVADAPEANGPPHLLNPLDEPAASLVPGVTITLDDRPSGWYPFHTQIGEYHGFAPDELDFQWQRCDSNGLACEDIEGSHFSTYFVTGEDVGSTVRVLSSAQNSEGSATTTSEPSEVVHALAKPVAPISLEVPQSLSPPREKDTMRVPANRWGDASGELSQFNDEGRAYQWLRCDAEGEKLHGNRCRGGAGLPVGGD